MLLPFYMDATFLFCCVLVEIGIMLLGSAMSMVLWMVSLWKRRTGESIKKETLLFAEVSFYY
jgi:hypothetical protein